MAELGDLAVQLESLFGDIFAMRPTRDVKLALTIALVEAAHGAKKDVTFGQSTACAECAGKGGAPGATFEPCASCAGTGEKHFTRGDLRVAAACPACKRTKGRWTVPCRSCDGRGSTRVEKKLAVTIPPGAASGQVLRLPGQGNDLGDGRGDVQITLHVAPHPTLHREGDDLHARALLGAAAGGEIRVPWLEGDVRVPVPRGASHGTEVRVPGWGCVKLGASYSPPRRYADSTRGDLIVELVDREETRPAHEVLGISRRATRPEIDHAYHHLVAAAHRAGDPAAQAQLGAAYAKLVGAAPPSVDVRPPPPDDARVLALGIGILAVVIALSWLFLR